MGIINGIVLGFAANIIFALCVRFLPSVKNVTVNSIILKIAHIGIDAYYPNRKKANRYIYEDNKNTSILKVLTNRGDSFADQTRENDWAVALWDSKPKTLILLLNPNSDNAIKRAGEIKIVSKIPGWDYNHFKTDIENNAAKLKAIPNTIVKYHDDASVFRLTITEKYAYISGFPSNALGYSKPVYRVKNESFLYNIFNKYYDYLWLKSQDV